MVLKIEPSEITPFSTTTFSVSGVSTRSLLSTLLILFSISILAIFLVILDDYGLILYNTSEPPTGTKIRRRWGPERAVAYGVRAVGDSLKVGKLSHKLIKIPIFH